MPAAATRIRAAPARRAMVPCRRESRKTDVIVCSNAEPTKFCEGPGTVAPRETLPSRPGEKPSCGWEHAAKRMFATATLQAARGCSSRRRAVDKDEMLRRCPARGQPCRGGAGVGKAGARELGKTLDFADCRGRAPAR